MTREMHEKLRKLPEDKAEIGDILIYLLKPAQRPVCPEQRWLGKIKSVHMTTYNKRSYFVESLEFPGDCEMVYPTQIVGYIAQPDIVLARPQRFTQELDLLL